MKKHILSYVLLCLVAIMAYAQELPIDNKTGKITFLEVIETPGLTAKDLYKIAKDWGQAKGFKPTKDNEAEGELTYDLTLPVDYERTKGTVEKSKVTYKFHIFTKEGKYRYILTDLVHTGSMPALTGGKLESGTPACSLSGINAGNWILIKKKAQAGAEATIADFKRVVKEAQNDPTKSKDW